MASNAVASAWAGVLRFRLSVKIACSNGSSAAMTVAVRSDGPVMVIVPHPPRTGWRRVSSEWTSSAVACSWARDDAAAMTRSHSVRRPFTPAWEASSTSRPADVGSAATAVVTSSACAADNTPVRIADATTGCSNARVAVFVVARAAPTVVPLTEASHPSTSRNESSPGPAPDATSRPVASSLPAAATRSSSAKPSTSSRAAAPDRDSTSTVGMKARASRSNVDNTRSTSTGSGRVTPAGS